MKNKRNWAFWIDRGGTFTDIIACLPDGTLETEKRLSESPDGTDPAIAGISHILTKSNARIEDVSLIRMGTTIGTNALLERNGAPTAFVTTEGFADAVRIGYQHRPNIFALQILLPEMIYQEVIEFRERLDCKGNVLTEPDLEKLHKDLLQVYEKGIRSCAIALLHAYKFPQHELAAARLAKEIGFTQVSASHDCAALMKYISRADTTLVDAYLTPLLKDYVNGLRKQLGNCRLQFMQSNGGLSDASSFRGKDCILSGPAGGLVGAIKVAQACGFDKLITFDMGGTSTDVSYFGGEIEHIYDTEISGMRIRAPMMDIHTVAAGGGSILSFDGSRYRVGPDSAGANPGPMCYRRGGPLTITDANLMLGRIQSYYFPKIFGPNQDQPLDSISVEAVFSELSQRISKKSCDSRQPEEVAFGFVKIAVAKMANAIKHISVQRGHDPRECALVCFGGAGGQHACLIAEELGIKHILIHPLAGLLSAYGIGLAETRFVREVDVHLPTERVSDLDIDALVIEVKDEFSKKETVRLQNQELSIDAHIYMEGSDYTLLVPFGTAQQMENAFNEKHFRRYGFTDEKRKLILGSLSIQLVGTNSPTGSKAHTHPVENKKDLNTSIKVFAGSKTCKRWHEAILMARSNLCAGKTITGPAVITEDNTTTIIDPGWQAELLTDGTLHLTPVEEPSLTDTVEQSSLTDIKQSTLTDTIEQSTDTDNAEHSVCMNAIEPCAATELSSLTASSVGASHARPQCNESGESQKADPVTLELFNNLFKFVAEQMGLTLQNTSHSVNIKERLDFSCALFDREGNLIANAPHIPVHLGSMGESVKSLIQSRGNSMLPGDAYATNDPYSGGTHLPDITVISPAFDKAGQILFFVASRGHHADIGGITPGSMPSESSSIEEEGVMLQHALIMRAGKILESEIKKQLSSGKYPARNPSQNLADLKAQIAANSRGITQLQDLMASWGQETVVSYMEFVQANAEACVRRAISALRSGCFESTMDDGSTIAVKIDIDHENHSARIDFSDTSLQTKGNFNAPLAVCKAAVLYVFRTLVAEEIPLNAGCFRPLELIVPEGCLLNPRYPAPVVAGNVETSQVIVDVLYAALGVMAASQGTMNNLSFGNERYQYYETICGGTGAGADFCGTGPVHSNMTNSRLTDPEVLESRYPVLLETFKVRKGSGGKGRQNGGDGAIRQIRFLEAMTASILSNRRIHSPHGLNGGSAGLCGKNYLLHGNHRQDLPFRTSFEIKAGESLCIETPGGGGFGFAGS